MSSSCHWEWLPLDGARSAPCVPAAPVSWLISWLITDVTSLALVDTAACSIPSIQHVFSSQTREVATSSPSTQVGSLGSAVRHHSIQWSTANLLYLWDSVLWGSFESRAYGNVWGFECFNQGRWNQYTLLSDWPERNVHLLFRPQSCK